MVITLRPMALPGPQGASEKVLKAISIRNDVLESGGWDGMEDAVHQLHDLARGEPVKDALLIDALRGDVRTYSSRLSGDVAGVGCGIEIIERAHQESVDVFGVKAPRTHEIEGLLGNAYVRRGYLTENIDDIEVGIRLLRLSLAGLERVQQEFQLVTDGAGDISWNIANVCRDLADGMLGSAFWGPRDAPEGDVIALLERAREFFEGGGSSGVELQAVCSSMALYYSALYLRGGCEGVGRVEARNLCNAIYSKYITYGLEGESIGRHRWRRTLFNISLAAWWVWFGSRDDGDGRLALRLASECVRIYDELHQPSRAASARIRFARACVFAYKHSLDPEFIDHTPLELAEMVARAADLYEKRGLRRGGRVCALLDQIALVGGRTAVLDAVPADGESGGHGGEWASSSNASWGWNIEDLITQGARVSNDGNWRAAYAKVRSELSGQKGLGRVGRDKDLRPYSLRDALHKVVDTEVDGANLTHLRICLSDLFEADWAERLQNRLDQANANLEGDGQPGDGRWLSMCLRNKGDVLCAMAVHYGQSYFDQSRDCYGAAMSNAVSSGDQALALNNRGALEVWRARYIYEYEGYAPIDVIEGALVDLRRARDIRETVLNDRGGSATFVHGWLQTLYNLGFSNSFKARVRNDLDAARSALRDLRALENELSNYRDAARAFPRIVGDIEEAISLIAELEKLDNDGFGVPEVDGVGNGAGGDGEVEAVPREPDQEDDPPSTQAIFRRVARDSSAAGLSREECLERLVGLGVPMDLVARLWEVTASVQERLDQMVEEMRGGGEMPPGFPVRLEGVIREAQVDLPRDRRRFVTGVNELFDGYSLRAKLEDDTLARLVLSGRSVQFGRSQGNVGFRKIPFSVERITLTRKGLWLSLE